MADTLKAQHTAYLTAGCVCYSDMGRILCSITADSCGWHDTICGLSDAARVADEIRRQHDSRSSATTIYKNGRDSMLNELGKYGLGKRDLIANINFFSRVTVDERGALHFRRTALPRGRLTSICASRCTRCWCCRPVRIRSIPTPQYRPRPVALRAWFSRVRPRARIPAASAARRMRRGFRNTEMMFLA